MAARWFAAETYAALRHGAALCLAERDEMSTPEVRTAGFMYLQLRKTAYSAAALRRVAERVERYGRDGDVFAFFRQDGVAGPFYAGKVAREVGAAP